MYCSLLSVARRVEEGNISNTVVFGEGETMYQKNDVLRVICDR